jgi:hypothetical protein
LILDFDPIEEEALLAYAPGVDRDQGLEYIGKGKEVINSLADDVMAGMKQAKQSVTKEVDAILHPNKGSKPKLGASQYWMSSWEDYYFFIWYFGYGMIDVLPDEGFVNLCVDVF